MCQMLLQELQNQKDDLAWKVEKGVTSQGVQVAPRNWKRQENKSAPEPPERLSLANT